MLSIVWRTLPALASCAFSVLQAKRLGANVQGDERAWRTMAFALLFVAMLANGSGALAVCVMSAGLLGLVFVDPARHPPLPAVAWLLFFHSLYDALVVVMALPFVWGEREHTKHSSDAQRQMAVFFCQYMAFTCACVSVAAL